MTQQDDITQRVLTDDEIRAVWVEHGLDDEAVEDFARAIESAVLSKLRAPVADERDRNATISQIVGLCNRIPGATTWNAAQFMYDEMHRRAALASAPVAGEAQTFEQWWPLESHRRKYPTDHPAYLAAQEAWQAQNSNSRYAAKSSTCDAAPQASAEYERGHADGWAAAWDQAQAYKDGGQQRAEDAERWRWATATDENAQMLYTIVQAYGGDQQKINERADFYRAALSATQEPPK